ncbi:MAG: SRPBCC family protein [Bryobacteraceae bacterium]|nr:SRPBCC family protein [Bryobacteraceae bacterium]
MDEYERVVDVNTPAGDVFDYLANIENLPGWLPGAQEVYPVSADRFRLKGIIAGYSLDTIVQLRVDREHSRIEWNVGDHHRGWLTVRQGDTTDALSEVTVSVVFEPGLAERCWAPMEPSDRETAVYDYLGLSLDSLRRQVEGPSPPAAV